jgi:hypothetical protein
MGDCLLLGSFQKLKEVAQNVGLLLHSIDYVLILTKKWIGLQSVRFSLKRVWSPCCGQDFRQFSPSLCDKIFVNFYLFSVTKKVRQLSRKITLWSFTLHKWLWLDQKSTFFLQFYFRKKDSQNQNTWNVNQFE